MSRGNSLVAGVVLIGLLGSLAIALQASNPNIEPIEQVAAVKVATKHDKAAPKADASVMSCDPGYDYKIVEKGGGKYEPEAILKDKATADYCKSTPENIKVRPPTPTISTQAKPTAVVAAAGAIAKYEKKGDPKCDGWKGKVEWCIPKELRGDKTRGERCWETSEKCDPTKGLSKAQMDKGREQHAPGVLKDEYLKAKELGDKERADLLKNTIQADPTTQKYLDKFIDDDIAEKQKALDEQGGIAKKAAADADAAAKIAGDKCSDMDGSTPGCDKAAQDYINAQNKADEEAKKLEELEAAKKRLADAKNELKPTSRPDDSGNPKKKPGDDPDKRPPRDPRDPPYDPNRRDPRDEKDKNNTFPPQKGGQQGGGGQPKQQPNQQQYQCQQGQYMAVQQNQYSYCANGNIYTYNNYSCQYQIQYRCPSGQCAGVGSMNDPTYYVTNPSGQSNTCAPTQNPNPTAQAPKAEIKCGGSGKFDVGMKVPISWSCANSNKATGSGFTISNESSTSGSAEPEIQKPPKGTNTVQYGLTCTASDGRTDTASCKVDINVTSMILVSNPQETKKGEKVTLGWVTKGMSECHISSDDYPEFTKDNENKDNVSGTAKTPSLTKDSDFNLTCTTLGGQEKEIDITVDLTDA